jgi:hypothetical protein
VEKICLQNEYLTPLFSVVIYKKAPLLRTLRKYTISVDIISACGNIKQMIKYKDAENK